MTKAKIKYRNRLKRWMKNKISFRLHMSLIMLSTVFLGIVSNFVMMKAMGVNHPALRYPLTVILSYCWFLLFIRIYIRSILLPTNASTTSELIDLNETPDVVISKNHTESGWSGDGGSFSGGGASGSWGEGEAASSGITSFADDEGGALITILVGGAFAILVFGSGAYFIWYSPEILSECLIQIILVSGMRKNMKKFTEAEWLGHIFRATRWPFIFVFVFSIILGSALRGICPEASNFRDYRTQCWKG